MSIRPQILCIDDEEGILEGLELNLRALGEVRTATSGADALRVALDMPALAVVICDMRMPGRDGAQVLADFHRRYPDATRILLTGYTDVEAAIAAVNHGQIFRFLSKPCPREVLHAACRAALRQNELLRAERELLELTLKGCIDAMTDALAMASPAVFGQAQRLRTLGTAVARRMSVPADWVLEVAAMLLHLGLVGLPEPVAAALLRGDVPVGRDQVQVAQGLRHAMATLQPIPRLGPVRDVIRLCEPASGGNFEWTPENQDTVRAIAAVLRGVRSFVRLEAAGFGAEGAVLKLKGVADAAVLDAIAAEVGTGDAAGQLREVGLSALAAGMVLARPLMASNGQLLAPAGYEIRDGFARRLAELRPELRAARFHVIVAAAPLAPAAAPGETA